MQGGRDIADTYAHYRPIASEDAPLGRWATRKAAIRLRHRY